MSNTDIMNSIKEISIRWFGKIADKNKQLFIRNKKYFESSGIDMFYRTYVSIALFATMITAILSVIFSTLLFVIFRNPYIFLILLSPVVAFLLSYFYPNTLTVRRKNSINANLPFAINHMYAIAASGAPPVTIFKLLAKLKEYGEISNESKRIVTNMEVLGMDEITALEQVSSRTPSKQFKDLLDGISYSIKRGGSTILYLREKSKSAMFDYTIDKQKYGQTLSVYADIYTALLVAAPLMFIVILSVLNVIGGELFGMPVNEFIKIGVFILIPLLNVLFLFFIHVTQPKV